MINVIKIYLHIIWFVSLVNLTESFNESSIKTFLEHESYLASPTLATFSPENQNQNIRHQFSIWILHIFHASYGCFVCIPHLIIKITISLTNMFWLFIKKIQKFKKLTDITDMKFKLLIDYFNTFFIFLNFDYSRRKITL